MNDYQLPEIDIIFDHFVERHNIVETELLKRDRMAIYWIASTYFLVNKGYSEFSEEILNSKPLVGLLLHLLHRIYEHTEGSVVAFNTGFPASSETIARVVVEGSVNVMYILAGDRVNRLESYFRNYLETTEQRADKWLRARSQLKDDEANAHKSSANRRLEYNKEMEALINLWSSQMDHFRSKSSLEKWPSVYNRFTSLGLETFYRTVYTRMCSQTHVDAEDTINYFYGVISGDTEFFNRAAIETLNFSRLLVYYGISFYIKSNIRYAETYGLDDELVILKHGREFIENCIHDLSFSIGAI